MYQGLLVLGIYFLLLGFVYLLKVLHLASFEPLDYWKYSTAMIFFYMMVNGVFCFSAKEKMIYYRDSIFTYVGLLVILSILSRWLSGVSIFEAESYPWIVTVFSIVYIAAITIINLMRKIVDIAIKQDKKLTDEK
jgi:hypothetical protein